MAHLSTGNGFMQRHMNMRATGRRGESHLESYEKIRRYNFRVPNRFTKEQIRVLRGIYEKFATSLSSHLSALLRKFCQVELVSVEEHSFSEFNSVLVDPVVLAIIDLMPAQGQGFTLMEISPSLARGIIDRLMGGAGKYTSRIRQYTEIEIALMEKLVSQFMDIMCESWSVFTQIEPKLERIETRSQFAQIIPGGEIVAIITFSVDMGEVEGTINYCFPHVVVDSLIKDVKVHKTEYFDKKIPPQESKAKEILSKIEKTPLKLVAAFQDTNVTTKEVMTLQVGDVLLIDHKVSEPVNVQAKGITKFKGCLGTKNNKRCVKVLNKITFDELA